MKRIAVYSDNRAIVEDSETISNIVFQDEEPIEYVEFNDENLKTYFPNQKRNISNIKL